MKLLEVLAWMKRNQAFIGWMWAMIASVIGLVLWLAGQRADMPPLPGPPPPILQPVPAPGDADSPYGTGWVNDPDAVAAVAETRPIRVFSDTPAGKVADVPKAVYLWKLYEELFARPPPVKDQKDVGSCVSFGTGTAIERTLAAEIAAGSAFKWTRFVEEATYGGSRVEIGGGRIRGDGSVGAWAAQWATKYGMVPRKKYPMTDLSEYSTALCRQWGSAGVPTEFEAVAREFPVRDTTQVKTWDEAKKALASGYAVAICSGQGFRMQRDANGVCAPSGSWAHCMCLDGYHTDDAGKEYGHIVNSWGATAHTGPVGWGNPNPDGFWADASVVAGMLRQNDSWTFSGVKGFPAKKLDWTRAPAPRSDPFDRLRTRRLVPPSGALAW